ncbi:ABC transporter permease [Ensifer sp. BR816]|uniref:ABC transporter permease n=1 Tax=Rhizobium sp. (strain BR816) TaxID=1057002 RepID=UPI00037E03F3|nr:ABC transporter permease [Ensifer sp. BR816]
MSMQNDIVSGRAMALTENSQWRQIRELFGRAPTLIRVAGVTIAACYLIALLSPLLSPYGPADQDLLARLQPPAFLDGTWSHPLGTDHLGRDVLSRLLHALNTTLVIATLGVIVGVVTGGLAGLISGLAGRRVDGIFMLLVDAQASVPLTLLALAAVALSGSSTLVLVLIVGISDYDKYARVVRSQVLVIKNRAFVESARALGASPVRVAFRHVLPSIVSPLTVLATSNFSSVVILESALSFLGVGIQPPDTSLGAMLGEARNYLITNWWLAAIPTALIVVITMAVSLLGDWLRDLFDRRLST